MKIVFMCYIFDGFVRAQVCVQMKLKSQKSHKREHGTLLSSTFLGTVHGFLANKAVTMNATSYVQIRAMRSTIGPQRGLGQLVNRDGVTSSLNSL